MKMLARIRRICSTWDHGFGRKEVIEASIFNGSCREQKAWFKNSQEVHYTSPLVSSQCLPHSLMVCPDVYHSGKGRITNLSVHENGTGIQEWFRVLDYRITLG
jgi:hypothetical protein